MATILSLIIAITLSSGPICLDFAIPHLEKFLSKKDSDLTLKMDQASLAWDPDNTCLVIQTQGVHVQNRGAEYKSIQLPHFEFRYNLASLFMLQLLPSEIAVVDAKIDLYQDDDGNLSLSNSPSEFEGISLESLNKLEIKNLQIHVVHKTNHQHWELPQTDVQITRAGQVLNCAFKTTYMDASVTATATYHENESLILKGLLSNFDFNHLDKFWHKDLAPAPRSWIMNNLSDAQVSKATIDAEWNMKDHAFELNHINGQINFTGMKVRYFDEMPAVMGVNGIANYDHKKFDIKVTSGTLKDVRVQSGFVHIYDMDKSDQKIDIDIDLAGPISTIVNILKTEPIDINNKLGIRLSKVDGVAKGKLHFDFPLETTITINDIQFKAKAALTNVATLGLRNGAFDLTVDRSLMEMSGHADYEGILTSLKWTQKFDDDFKDWKAKYQAQTQLSPEQMVALGFDGYTDKPVSLHATLLEKEDKKQTLQASLNLLNLKLPGYATNDACQAGLEATLVDGNLTQISDAHLTGKDLNIRPKIRVDAENHRIKSIDCPGLILGKNRLDVQLTSDKKSNYMLAIKGKSLDVDAWVLHFKGKNDTNIQTPFHFTCDIERGLYGNKHIQNLKAKGAYGVDGLQAFDASASFVNDQEHIIGAFHATQRLEDDHKRIDIISNNAGETINLFGYTSFVQGGDLHFMMSKAKEQKWQGKLKLKDFHVTDAPVATHILSLASPFGIIHAVKGTPMAFEKFSTKLSFDNDRLTFKDGRAVGSSIGLTIAGHYDSLSDEINLHGTILPYNAVNVFFAKIPVISTMIGGKSGGLLGVNYSLTGSKNSPSTFVNPLSVLTPGILREVFSHQGSGDE